MVAHQISQINNKVIALLKQAKRDQHAAYMRRVYRPSRRRLECTFLPEEWGQIEAACRRRGERPGGFVRQAALGEATGDRVLPQDVRDELAQIQRLLRNMANNVNQCARKANMGVAKLWDLGKMASRLQRLEREIEASVRTRLLEDGD